MLLGTYFYDIYDVATSSTAWITIIEYTFILLIIAFIVTRYDKNYVRKIAICVSLLFVYVMLTNRLLFADISYSSALFPFFFITLTQIFKLWNENKNIKQLILYLLVWFVFVPSLFIIFDQRLTTTGQMEHDVNEYLNESSMFQNREIQSLNIVSVSLVTSYARVVFKDEPNFVYLIFDRGSTVEFLQKKELWN
ncbi:hypothetical protein BFG57_01195 [Bacillus solimangrovi]|uniref:Uncharacterized protein n=1 Tax=Bacillus solimangrovi TaxID=1305675 RepID=A0A1E5LHU2_9BACI|nr:hypothetical protein BFG57_01195 [Bacillus solimangrovi]